MPICSSIVMAPQMPDDAFIYLRIAQNIAQHGQWAFNPGIPVDAATSALYGLLLSLLVSLRFPQLTAPLIVASALGLGVLAIAVYRGMRGYGKVAAMFAAFIASAFPALLRSEGMETALYLACIALTALAVQADNECAAGALAGLTTVARPEGAMIVPLALGVLWWRSRRLPWRAFLIAATPLCLWFAYCLHAFHAIVPHTVKIKSLQSSMPTWHRSWFREFVMQLEELRYLARLGGLGLFLSLKHLRRAPFCGIVLTYGIAQVLSYSMMRAPVTYFWYAAPGDLAYLLSLAVGWVAVLGWVGRRRVGRRVVSRSANFVS
jgi:hypothetical protein